jgi:hypothetical protein
MPNTQTTSGGLVDRLETTLDVCADPAAGRLI